MILLKLIVYPVAIWFLLVLIFAAVVFSSMGWVG